MSRYLITGGEGFIGGKITSKTGGVAYDIKSGLDILDTNNLIDALATADGIFHCAAKISVPESIKVPEEYYKHNVMGTKSVISAAESRGIKIVFSSSAAVYGETTKIVDELSPLNPKSPYAENKKDGEILLKESSVPHIALRYFNVYGPGQSPEYAGVITAFILNALRGEPLKINGDGKQVRDFIYIDDIVSANEAAMSYNNTAFEVFNIGTGIETSIQHLAETIIRLTNSSSKIEYGPQREGDIVYSQPDVSRARNILGFTAKVNLEEGLKETITFYR